MPRINEIPREKAVSDVLHEKKGLTPLQDEFLPRLEQHLCREFGINDDSPFLDELHKKCEYLAEKTCEIWRKHHCRQIEIFKNHRGMYRVSRNDVRIIASFVSQL